MSAQRNGPSVSSDCGIIRDVSADDAPGVHAIYAPFVQSTVTSFEWEVPSVEEMRGRILRINEKYPFLVFETEGVVGGYAYASPHKERKSYCWVCETSVYLAPQHRGKGIAKLLMNRILSIVTELGYVWAMMGISGENEASERLHLGLGFKELYRWQQQGCKFGHWVDVKWYKKLLREDYLFPSNPPVPITYSEYKSSVQTHTKEMYNNFSH